MSDDFNVTTGLSDTEVQELVAYVNGDMPQAPAALGKLQTGLYRKMQEVSGYTVAAEVSRQAKLSKFLGKIEDELFDDNLIATMSRDDLMDLHERVTKEAKDSREFVRKYLVQNRDTINSKHTEQEKLAAKLSQLPADKLDAIKKILEGEQLMPSELETEFNL